MRASSILLVLLLAVLPARAENPAFAWSILSHDGVVPAQSSTLALYANREAVIVDYATAMRQFRATAEREGYRNLAAIFLPNDRPVRQERYTWVAQNGDSIRRTGDGVFRLARGNYRQNWFFEVECRVIDWPMLYCTDDQQRMMSAPDERTVIFDGVSFTR